MAPALASQCRWEPAGLPTRSGWDKSSGITALLEMCRQLFDFVLFHAIQNRSVGRPALATTVVAWKGETGPGTQTGEQTPIARATTQPKRSSFLFFLFATI